MSLKKMYEEAPILKTHYQSSESEHFLMFKVTVENVEMKQEKINMNNIKRLGLGTMGMRFSNKETSINTIHTALDSGITLFNMGEFYTGRDA